MMKTLMMLMALVGASGCGGARSAPKFAPTPAEASTGGLSQAGAPRLMVKRASLTLEVEDEDDYESAGEQIEAVAKALQGHIVGRQNRFVTLRVPAAQLDAAIAGIGALGELTQRNISAVDGTAQVTDLKVRIDNLATLRTRLKGLVDRAEIVKDLIELEKELARVTGELERLQAQQRGLGRDVAMSHISVRLEEEVSPGPIGWVFYGLFRGVKWLFVWD